MPDEHVRGGFEREDTALSLVDESDEGNVSLDEVQEARLSDVEAVAQTAQLMASTAAVKTSPITTADIAAAPVAYDQAHTATLVALVNELKAKINLMN